MATKKVSKPQPRDFSGEMQDIGKYGGQFAGQQGSQALSLQAQAFPQMLDQSMGAVDRIATGLNNGYTASALGAINEGMGNMRLMGGYADRVSGLGAIAEGDVAGTQIEQQLNQQALQELALGRSLSAEQERAAQQSARAGFSARGMGTGTASAVAEILSRDAFATERENSRRNFAGATNQMISGNRIARLGAAGNLLGQGAGIRQNMASLGFQGAQAYIATDPYQRSLQSNIPGAVLGASSQMANIVPNAYGQVMSYGQDLNNTNYNAAWSDYLNQQNNAAALRSGQMQANAATSAAQTSSNGATTGALIGGAAAIGGIALAAF